MKGKKKITLSFGANWFQYNCIKFPLILFPLSNCLRFVLWSHTCSPSGSITSSVCRGKHRFLGFQRSCSQKPCLFTSWNSCLTWAHFQPWNLSFEPAPWGSFCGWFPFSSPKWRGPNFETWCHEEGRPLRHPPAWVSSSEGLRRLCTADPWEDVDAASGCAIKWYLQKRGRACPSFTRSPDVISHPPSPALLIASCPRSRGNCYLCSSVQSGDHNGNGKLTLAFLCIISSDPKNNFVRKVGKHHSSHVIN